MILQMVLQMVLVVVVFITKEETLMPQTHLVVNHLSVPLVPLEVCPTMQHSHNVLVGLMEPIRGLVADLDQEEEAGTLVVVVVATAGDRVPLKLTDVAAVQAGRTMLQILQAHSLRHSIPRGI
jgi:predicted membrane GTPase involved in stress response